ncbi:MAG: 4-hydroxy-tetrahydrodipicolinate reductase [Planctomycetaceae bacterium]|nr:4-hydroxy-tetrahydrodipicolinate reductase [Planctomycetaceae bacterium]
MTTSLIINGAAGRMGKRIITLAREAGTFRLVGAVDLPQHPDLGKDIGCLAGLENLGVPLSDKLEGKADVVIDFSSPQAADATIDFCRKTSTPLVLGTTGLSKEQLLKVSSAATKIPIVQSTNMSQGMNLLFAIVGKVAKALGPDYDIEIVEAHHRFKKDAPSGSALSLAEAICKEAGLDYPGSLTFGREGKEALRQKGTIGIHAVRAGDIVGRHSVLYSTLGETITIEHNAHSRDTLARGAIRAAEWVATQKPGLYKMLDVLGLNE